MGAGIILKRTPGASHLQQLRSKSSLAAGTESRCIWNCIGLQHITIANITRTVHNNSAKNEDNDSWTQNNKEKTRERRKEDPYTCKIALIYSRFWPKKIAGSHSDKGQKQKKKKKKKRQRESVLTEIWIKWNELAKDRNILMQMRMRHENAINQKYMFFECRRSKYTFIDETKQINVIVDIQI